MKSKFLDIVTGGSTTVTVNADNIAIFERIGSGAKITLNITNDDGKFIIYNSLIQMTTTNNPLFKDE